jgi:NTE family protein
MMMEAAMLSGGGARAAYQVGVLNYIAERCPGFHFPILTGVSAGAINAAFLAGDEGSFPECCRDLKEAWRQLCLQRTFRTDTLSMTSRALKWFLSLGASQDEITPRFESLMDTTPLREYLSKVIKQDRIEENITSGRLHALALTALRYSTGESVTFVQARPGIPLWERQNRKSILTRITIDHVMASSALPLVFPAAKVDGDYYGDGAIRHHTPLSPAAHLGASRILAISGHHDSEISSPGTYPSPARMYGHMIDSVFLDGLGADAERLDRINRLLDLLPASDFPVWGMRPIDLMIIRPSKDPAALAARHIDLMPRTLRLLMRGMGAHRSLNADLLSYLMFEEPFINDLHDLGYADAEGQWEKLSRFLRV